MIRVNAVGSIIETLYCLILFWRSEPNQLTRPLLSCLAVCLGTLAAVQMFDDIEDGKSFLGTINVIVNMITFTTPLLTVKQVLRWVLSTRKGIRVSNRYKIAEFSCFIVNGCWLVNFSSFFIYFWAVYDFSSDFYSASRVRMKFLF